MQDALGADGGQTTRPSRSRMGPEKCRVKNVSQAYFRHRDAQLFSCEILSSVEVREDLEKNHSTIAMEEHLRTFVQKIPLEILATFILELKIKHETAVKLFSSYNAFLALLDDADQETPLEETFSRRNTDRFRFCGSTQHEPRFSRRFDGIVFPRQ
jgi:hypothetical protein